MSTRLHALGFPAAWTAEVADQVRALAEQGRVVAARKGSYRHWRSRDGAELWFHYPKVSAPQPAAKGNPADAGSDSSKQARPAIDIIAPFHRGQSAVKVRIGRVLAMDRANPLEGSCLAWLPKTDDGWREQAIVLELVPFAGHVIEPRPYVTTAQIACFAHALWAFDRAEAYAAQTPQHRRIKLGAYSPMAHTDVPEVAVTYRHPPVTLGLVTGIVRRSIRLTNPATGEPYYWLALETKRGLFDVLVNPAVVQGDISEGNIAQAYGSFLARLEKTTV